MGSRIRSRHRPARAWVVPTAPDLAVSSPWDITRAPETLLPHWCWVNLLQRESRVNPVNLWDSLLDFSSSPLVQLVLLLDPCVRWSKAGPVVQMLLFEISIMPFDASHHTHGTHTLFECTRMHLQQINTFTCPYIHSGTWAVHSPDSLPHLPLQDGADHF